MKRDLPVFVDRVVQPVHGVEHGAFFPLGGTDVHIPLQSVCLIGTGERSDFFDKFFRLFLRNEVRRLHRVDHDLQFRNGEGSARHEVLILYAPVADDVESHICERSNILRDGLAGCDDSLFAQMTENLRDGCRMVVVRVLSEVL